MQLQAEATPHPKKSDGIFKSAEQRMRNRLIGRLGEHVIEQVLTSAGFIVAPCGYEKTMPAVKGELWKFSSDAALQVRTTPDFLVLSPDGESGLIQVKATTQKKKIYFKKDALKEDVYWKSTEYLIVNFSKSNFGIWRVKKFEETGNLRKFCFDDDSSEYGYRLGGTKLFGTTVSERHVTQVLTGMKMLLNDMSS